MLRLDAAAATAVLQDECEEKLAVAMPAMNAAITALNTLKQNDITIVKAMQNPPPAVKLVMEAVCILKVRHQRVPAGGRA